MRIAFLAPIKPPDHPIASGDRLIARNLVAALEDGGHEVVLASRFIAYSKRPEGLTDREAAALAEAEATIERLRTTPPDLALTYHPYCKAPDWIGPRIARAFGVPYITVEAARASVQGEAWQPWRDEAAREMAAADLHIWLKPTDRDMLRARLGPDVPLAHLAPFIDVETIDAIEGSAARGTHRVLVVGQMRPGKKRRNHEIAAEALARLAPGSFEALVIGDGPERRAIEPLYPPGTRFLGAVPHERVIREMRGADVFLWPGWREPIGMVYLEAAACALPTIATSDMGVPLVVEHGRTGLLSAPDDPVTLADNLRALLADGERRATLGRQARDRAMRHHSLDSATMALQSILASLPARGDEPPG